jgi:hypothetical protein
MMQKREENELVRRYLLGDLHENQQDEIEERLLTDEELQAQLLEVQDDLIDDYVSGGLSESDGNLFKRNFLLTPERLHRLRLSRALLDYAEVYDANSQITPKGLVTIAPWHKPGRFLQQHRSVLAISVAILLVFLGYVGWSIYRHQQLETRMAELHSQRLKVEDELKKLNAGELAEQQAAITTLELNQILIRDTGEKRLAIITQGINILQLRLKLDENRFSVYRAVVETDEGVGIYIVDNLMVKSIGDAQVILLNLPSRLLPPGSYQIHLSGIASEKELVDIGIYPFQILLK